MSVDWKELQMAGKLVTRLDGMLGYMSVEQMGTVRAVHLAILSAAKKDVQKAGSMAAGWVAQTANLTVDSTASAKAAQSERQSAELSVSLRVELMVDCLVA